VLLQACVAIEISIAGNTAGAHSVNSFHTSVDSIVQKKRQCQSEAVSRRSHYSCDWANGVSAWELCRVTATSTTSSNDLVTHKLLGIPYVRCLEMSSDPQPETGYQRDDIHCTAHLLSPKA
jgi:hypothetical protein